MNPSFSESSAETLPRSLEILPRSSKALPNATHQGSEGDNPLHHPWRPQPDPATGELKIDPEILLKAQGMDLAISFFYSSVSDRNDQFGRARSVSTNAYILSSTSSNGVTITRGDLSATIYQRTFEGDYVTPLPGSNVGVYNALSFDGTTFTETFANGTKMEYQAQVGGGNPVKHELVRVVDAQGNAHTYSYGTGSEAGLLKTITVPGGNKVTFLYSASSPTSLLSAVQDWGGRRTTLQYDSARYMTTLMTPLGCTTKYGYSLAGTGSVTVVHTIEDPRGYVTTYLYDSNRRVTSMAAGSAVWTYTFATSPTSQSVVLSPLGARTTYLYDAGGMLTAVQRPEGYTSTFTYTNALKTSEQTPAGTVQATYDPTLWLVTSQTDALGNITSFAYDTFGNLTTLTNALA